MNTPRKTLNYKNILEYFQNELNNNEKIDILTLARICSNKNIRGHLAIFTNTYLDKIIMNKKTIESRFSKYRISPFGKVKSDDIIFMKQSSGPITAIAQVLRVNYYESMKKGEAKKIMERYNEYLKLEKSYVELKQNSAYGTLIHFKEILPINPVYIKKSDRRPWVALSETIKSLRTTKQSTLFTHPDCELGLHSYHKSTSLNTKGFRVCKNCGADVVDWKRIHKRDIKDIDYTISQLKSAILRNEWWTKKVDQVAKNHTLRKGLIKLPTAAFKRLKKSVGEVHEMPDGTKRPYRDGYQTPSSKNVIYYAQHALACCCRKCMQYFHGVPYGRNLKDQELKYFVELVMSYIKYKIPEVKEHGIYVPRLKNKVKK